MNQDMMQLWKLLRKYARDRVPYGHEEDFASYGVLQYLERGLDGNMMFSTVLVDFLRLTFGDTRTEAGRLASTTALYWTERLDAAAEVACAEAAGTAAVREEQPLVAPVAQAPEPMWQERRVVCPGCWTQYAQGYLKKHQTKCNGQPLSRAPKRRRGAA